MDLSIAASATSVWLAARPAAAVQVPLSTFSLFALALSAGVTACLPFVPLQKIGRRFFVLTTLLAIVFVCLALAVSRLELDYAYVVFTGLLIAYNVLLPRQRGVDWSARRERLAGGVSRWWTHISYFLLGAAIVSGFTGLVMDAVSYPIDLDMSLAQGPILCAQFLSSALLLGGVTVAMILGHWYLVARGLSFGPLIHLTLLTLCALVARMAAAGAGVAAQIGRWEELIALQGMSGFLVFPGVFVGARVLFGMLAPLCFVTMAWRCARGRSNQSATGILYVAVVFVLMGEIMAKYFLISQGLAI